MALENMTASQAYDELLKAGYEITGYDPVRNCFDASHKARKLRDLTVFLDGMLNVWKVQASW